MSEKASVNLTPEAADRIMAALHDSVTNRSAPSVGFVADDDLMTHLKAEYSALPPGGEEKMTELGIALVDCLTQLYGQYIPERVQDNSIRIVDRLMCLRNEDFKEFHYFWIHPEEDESEDTLAGGAFYTLHGRLMIYTPPPLQIFENLNNEVLEGLNQFGGIEEARKKIAMSWVINLLSHEIVHEYSNDFFYELNEAGAEYYSQQMMNITGFGHGALGGYGERPKAFYKELVEKYGEDMHRLFFGSPVDPVIAIQIMSEFTPEKRAELFPPKDAPEN